jgi:hypothetical protein
VYFDNKEHTKAELRPEGARGADHGQRDQIFELSAPKHPKAWVLLLLRIDAFGHAYPLMDVPSLMLANTT